MISFVFVSLFCGFGLLFGLFWWCLRLIVNCLCAEFAVLSFVGFTELGICD